MRITLGTFPRFRELQFLFRLNWIFVLDKNIPLLALPNLLAKLNVCRYVPNNQQTIRQKVRFERGCGRHSVATETRDWQFESPSMTTYLGIPILTDLNICC